METISIILLSIIAALLIFTAIFMIYAIRINIIKGGLFRQNLVNRVSNLRIHRMLRTLGIDIDRYLHQESILDIQEQMKICSECQNTDDCDRELERGTVHPNNISYCNNESDLKKIAQKQHRTG